MNTSGDPPPQTHAGPKQPDAYAVYSRWSLIFTGILAGMVLLMLIILFGTPHGPTYLPEPVFNVLSVFWLAMVLILNLSVIVLAAIAVIIALFFSKLRPSASFVATCATLILNTFLLIFLGPGVLLLLIYFIMATTGAEMNFK